jgi:ferredoxin
MDNVNGRTLDDITDWFETVYRFYDNQDLPITTCWVEPGCSLCGACNLAASNIFLLGEQSSEVSGDIRTDNQTTENHLERAEIKPELRSLIRDDVIAAAQCCPQQIVRFK